METTRTFKYFSLIGVLCGLFIATNVHAVGGMITVQQISNTQQLGKWILSTPEGKTYADHRGEYVQKIEPVIGGTYTLSIDEPRKAQTSIVVTRSNNEVIRSAKGTRIAFTVPGGEAVRIKITYSFFGTITVQSDPSDQSFVLRGSDKVTYTGTTPATFNNVAPLHYTVSYGHIDDCRGPRSQSRLLDPNELITFLGIYRCDPALTVGNTGPASRMEPKPEIQEPRMVNVILRANQTEVLPGGTVHYTLTVDNTSISTFRDLSVSVQFDPEKGSVAGARNGGTVQGSIIAWDIDKIYAGQQWSTQFAMKVNEDLKVGEQITLNTRVSSPGLVEEGVTDQQLISSVGVVLLPQTGDKIDILLAIFTVAASLILAISIRRKQHVVFMTA